MAEVDFSDLVREAEQLSAALEGTVELPRIERSLSQILEASKALWAQVSATGTQEAQAKFLLGSKGFDVDQLGQQLETLSSRQTFEPLDPAPLTAIQSFLKNESQNAILQLIESTQQNTFNHVDSLHHMKEFEEWHGHKTNVMNSLLGYSNQIVDVPMRKETVIHETLLGNRSMLGQEQMAYVRVLMEYNNAILRGFPNLNDGTNSQSLLERFSHVSLEFNNQKLSDMWKMLSYICQLPPQAKSSVLEARRQPAVQDKMILQALSYLESRYKEYMEITIKGNLRAARRGGVPGTIPTVKGFLNVRQIAKEPGLEDVMVEGVPLWPMIFYCLRCGDIPAAIQSLKLASQHNDDLITILEDVRDSPQRKVNLQAEMKLRNTYRRVVRSNPDPYKRAVYCLLGGCDVSDDHRSIVKTSDDYLWLKLWQVRDGENDVSHDRIRLSDLQKLVLEDDVEQYYKPSEQPHVYFQLLVLTGQWESAIDFLVRVDQYRSHAIHMAIAVHELNLLALPSNINAPLFVIDEADEPPMRRLNLLRLVLLYTGEFEHSDPKEILHYFFTLRKLPGKGEDKNAFVSCLIEYLMETKQYDLVLGTLEMDGCRNPGLLDAFEGSAVNVASCTHAIALATESRGFLEESVKLYYLCNNQQKVLSIMNVLLSQVLVKSNNDPTSLRSRVVKFAFQLQTRYHGEKIDCKMSTISTFELLQKLVTFFDMYHVKEYNRALDIIISARIIPMNSDELEDRINNFKLLEESVLKITPDILLAVMNIYYHQYQLVRGDNINAWTTALEDPSKTKQLSFIRERASLLTSFAGTIPYRMPGDTNTRLLQLEIRMA